MKRLAIRAGKLFAAFFFVSLLLFSQTVVVFADPLPESEQKALDNYPHWVGLCGSDISGDTAPSDTGPAPGPVYIMGDSITKLAKSTYASKFKSPWSATVEGLDSRQMTTTPPSPSGLGQLDKDKDTIGKAKAIVIALGTNSMDDTQSSVTSNTEAVKKTVARVNQYNKQNAPIYWVNVIDGRKNQDDASTKTNKAISDGVGSDATVIDWYTEAKSNADLSSFGEGVHPTKQKDIDLLVDLVYKNVTTDTASGGSSASTSAPDYIEAGKIKKSGLTVGATTYGGVYKDGKWQPSNNDQGGVKPYDDNGLNSYDGKPIAGHTAFAELGGGTLLGGLPYQKDGKPNTKLEITYKGKSIIAEKVDIGTGQSDDDHYKVDLWWETAKLLGVTDNVDIKIRVVPSSTPVTPLDGTPAKAANDPTNPPDGNQVCKCGEPDAGDTADVNSSDYLKAIFGFFVSNGYKDFQAAGIVGNIYAESTGSPQRYQGDEKDHETPPSPSPGWGIAQWTPNSKLTDYAKGKDKDPKLMSTQLEFLLAQLEGKSGSWDEVQAGNDIKASVSVTDATRAFQGDNKIGGKYSGFERPKDEAGSLQKRISAAKNALKKFGGTTSTASADATTPDATTGCACTDPSLADASDANKLADTLKTLAEKNGGKTTISVSSVDGNNKADFSGDDQVPTRSSYKVYTAYATLRAIEEGKISWSTPIWNGNSVEETMQEMIIKSNNDAAEALRTSSKIGTYTYVTKILQNDLGLSSKTVMGNGNAGDAKGTNTESTANDFVKFLNLLYKKKLAGVSKDSSYDKLIGFMKKATTDGGSARQGIVAGVGSGVEVADKPGWGPAGAAPASNDVGIVYLKDDPYVVAILTDKPAKWDGVAEIAKGINQAMGGTSGGGNDCASSGGSVGDLQQTVKKYAWPEYHKAPYTKAQPAYVAAYKKPA